MLQQRPWQSEADEQREADRQTASLGAIAITLFLLVVGLFLVRELTMKSEVEDCLLSGRRNCDLLVLNGAGPGLAR
jgi:hypothetical protein